jgi:hypothetical protein
LKAAIFLACALASAAIHADTVYRSVGPDGKVTYSQISYEEGNTGMGTIRVVDLLAVPPAPVHASA